MAATIIVLLVVLGLGTSFFITAGLTWLVCWAFSFAFTWKLALGVWAASCLISGAFKATMTVHTK